MKKIVKLTEDDLNRLVAKIIKEQSKSPKFQPYGSSPGKVPADTKLWQTLSDELNGEGPSIRKETPNQLIIDGLSGVWTITLNKFTN
jgi:hypothetical protein